MNAIDPDVPDTWPCEITAWVERFGRQRIEYAIHGGPRVDETEFRELLVGHRLLVRHSTRLMEHEEATIRRDGLRPVSAGLIEVRIDEAWRRGLVSEEERQELRRAHIWAKLDRDDAAENRTLVARGLGVYLLMGLRPLDDGHANEWLSQWGGPALYEGLPRPPAPSSLREKLRRVSQPAIVEATLEFSEERFPRSVGEPFGLVFSEILFGETALYGGMEVCHVGPVPPASLSRILHPGDGDYDRHAALPRD